MTGRFPREPEIDSVQSRLRAMNEGKRGAPGAPSSWGDQIVGPNGVVPSPQEVSRDKSLAALQAFASAIATLRNANVDVDPVAMAKSYGIAFSVPKNAEGPPVYGYHLSAGVVTANEVRERLGLPARDDGNELLTNTPKKESA